MSKMDALRAMREAKYAANAKRSAAAAPPSSAPKAKAPVAPATAGARKAAAAPTASTEPSADASVCGHRNMSGRTCTREAGHAAKSHRYS